MKKHKKRSRAKKRAKRQDENILVKEQTPEAFSNKGISVQELPLMTRFTLVFGCGETIGTFWVLALTIAMIMANIEDSGSVSLWIWLIPLLILLWAIRGIVQGRRDLRLVTMGKQGEAKLVEKIDTGLRNKSRHLYKLVFEYRDHNNNNHRKKIKTDKACHLIDGKVKRILYDPNNPGTFTFIDGLAGHPTLTTTGMLMSISTATSAWSVLSIIVVILSPLIGLVHGRDFLEFISIFVRH